MNSQDTRPSPRIVSLLPSSTEIACALGLEKQLVGRSHECDYPPSVKGLPVCTRPKFATHGSSREINQLVQSALQEGLSLYEVDFDRLKDLKPSHILTQTRCEVCAVSLKEVEQAVQGLTDCSPSIISLSPSALEDVWADIQRVADALSLSERGRSLVYTLKERAASIAEKAAEAKARPRVACVEWVEPLMAAGNWVPELVEMAGAVNLFGEAGRHSPWMSWEQLQEADPDVILFMPCGFDLERTRQEHSTLTRRPGWPGLEAVRGGQVFAFDGHQFFNRPGPRLVESLEILAEVLHPKLFQFAHEGLGWEKL